MGLGMEDMREFECKWTREMGLGTEDVRELERGNANEPGGRRITRWLKSKCLGGSDERKKERKKREKYQREVTRSMVSCYGVFRHSSLNGMSKGEIGKVLVMMSWFTLVLVYYAMGHPITELSYLWHLLG